VEYLDEMKVKALRRAATGTVLEGPVRTILGLGLRRNEMARLKWADINFDARLVTVRGTKTNKRASGPSRCPRPSPSTCGRCPAQMDSRTCC